MEITYTKHGDYYLPDLALPEEEPATYGRFGRMRSNSKISAVPKGSGLLNWLDLLLAAALLILTNHVKATKDLHPIVFIAFSALVGVVAGASSI